MTAPLSEAEFRGWITVTANANGWLVLHIEESNVAAPNLWLTRAGVLIAARVKAERAKVTDAQQEWLRALGLVQGIEVVEWRPSQMDEVFAVLAAPQKVREVA